jgi:O-antigen/teichoic acid export membrane protein
MTREPRRGSNRSFREWAFVNASSNIVGTLVTLGVWFVVTPVILHHLGLVQYGLWVLSTTIVAYAPLLDLGIGDAITRYVAAHRARGDSAAASRFVAAGFWIYVALGILTLALTALLAPFFAGLFHLPPSERARAAPVLALAGLNVAVAFPAITNLAVLRGLQRFDLVNVVGAGSTILTGVAIVLVLQAGGDVVALAAIGAPMEILSQIPMIAFIRRTAPDLRLRIGRPHRPTLRAVLSFGAAQAVARGARQVRTRSDELIIGAMRPLRVLTPYSLVHRLSQPAGQLSDQLIDTLLPMAAELHASRDGTRLRELFLAGTRAALGSYLLFGISIAILAQPFLRVWAGPQYTSSGAIAPLLVAAGMFGAAMLPAENVLAGMGRLRTPVLASVAAAAVKVGLAVALTFAFGVVGVAIASVAAALLTFVPIVVSGMRTVGIPARKVIIEIWVPNLAPAAVAAAAALLVRKAAGAGSVPAVLLAGAAGSAAFLPVYLLMPATALERSVLIRLLARLKRATGSAGRRREPTLADAHAEQK